MPNNSPTWHLFCSTRTLSPHPSDHIGLHAAITGEPGSAFHKHSYVPREKHYRRLCMGNEYQGAGIACCGLPPVVASFPDSWESTFSVMFCSFHGLPVLMQIQLVSYVSLHTKRYQINTSLLYLSFSLIMNQDIFLSSLHSKARFPWRQQPAKRMPLISARHPPV